MKCKVVKSCMISYGSSNKAWIHLNKGQIWELSAYPSKRFEWYSLCRYNVIIDIVKEDFDRIFEPQESEKDACKDCYYNDGEVHAECVICDKAESEE